MVFSKVMANQRVRWAAFGEKKKKEKKVKMGSTF